MGHNVGSLRHGIGLWHAADTYMLSHTHVGEAARSLQKRWRLHLLVASRGCLLRALFFV